MTNSKPAEQVPDAVVAANEAAKSQDAAVIPDGVKAEKVKTVFGHEVEVAPDEAASLRRHGLDAGTKPNIGERTK